MTQLISQGVQEDEGIKFQEEGMKIGGVSGHHTCSDSDILRLHGAMHGDHSHRS